MRHFEQVWWSYSERPRLSTPGRGYGVRAMSRGIGDLSQRTISWFQRHLWYNQLAGGANFGWGLTRSDEWDMVHRVSIRPSGGSRPFFTHALLAPGGTVSWSEFSWLMRQFRWLNSDESLPDHESWLPPVEVDIPSDFRPPLLEPFVDDDQACELMLVPAVASLLANRQSLVVSAGSDWSWVTLLAALTMVDEARESLVSLSINRVFDSTEQIDRPGAFGSGDVTIQGSRSPDTVLFIPQNLSDSPDRKHVNRWAREAVSLARRDRPYRHVVERAVDLAGAGTNIDLAEKLRSGLSAEHAGELLRQPAMLAYVNDRDLSLLTTNVLDGTWLGNAASTAVATIPARLLATGRTSESDLMEAWTALVDRSLELGHDEDLRRDARATKILADVLGSERVGSELGELGVARAMRIDHGPTRLGIAERVEWLADQAGISVPRPVRNRLLTFDWDELASIIEYCAADDGGRIDVDDVIARSLVSGDIRSFDGSHLLATLGDRAVPVLAQVLAGVVGSGETYRPGEFLAGLVDDRRLGDDGPRILADHLNELARRAPDGLEPVVGHLFGRLDRMMLVDTDRQLVTLGLNPQFSLRLVADEQAIRDIPVGSGPPDWLVDAQVLVWNQVPRAAKYWSTGWTDQALRECSNELMQVSKSDVHLAAVANGLQVGSGSSPRLIEDLARQIIRAVRADEPENSAMIAGLIGNVPALQNQLLELVDHESGQRRHDLAHLLLRYSIEDPDPWEAFLGGAARGEPNDIVMDRLWFAAGSVDPTDAQIRQWTDSSRFEMTAKECRIWIEKDGRSAVATRLSAAADRSRRLKEALYVAPANPLVSPVTMKTSKRSDRAGGQPDQSATSSVEGDDRSDRQDNRNPDSDDLMDTTSPYGNDSSTEPSPGDSQMETIGFDGATEPSTPQPVSAVTDDSTSRLNVISFLWAGVVLGTAVFVWLGASRTPSWFVMSGVVVILVIILTVPLVAGREHGREPKNGMAPQ